MLDGNYIFQFFQFFDCALHKLAVRPAARNKGFVKKSLPQGTPYGYELARTFIHAGFNKFLPDVTAGFFGRVNQIGGVKPVVAEVVQQEFICRKIIDVCIGGADGMANHSENRFTYTVELQRVAHMSYGTHGE